MSEAAPRGGVEFITLMLEDVRFAAELRHVREVRRFTSLTRVPHLPPGLAGVTNVRSRILPVVDLKEHVFGEALPYPPRSRLLVCEFERTPLALRVDLTREVLLASEEQILDVPATAAAPAAIRLITRLLRLDDDCSVGILDLAGLFARLLPKTAP